MQAQHMWVLQLHHDGYFPQKVSQFCAHGTLGTHTEGLDSHWDLEVGGVGEEAPLSILSN